MRIVLASRVPPLLGLRLQPIGRVVRLHALDELERADRLEPAGIEAHDVRVVGNVTQDFRTLTVECRAPLGQADRPELHDEQLAGGGQRQTRHDRGHRLVRRNRAIPQSEVPFERPCTRPRPAGIATVGGPALAAFCPGCEDRPARRASSGQRLRHGEVGLADQAVLARAFRRDRLDPDARLSTGDLGPELGHRGRAGFRRGDCGSHDEKGQQAHG